MANQRFDEAEYKGHVIRVYAEQYDEESAWTITVSVQRPDGSWFPDIEDNDHSYPSENAAFATGNEMGRNLIDQ